MNEKSKANQPFDMNKPPLKPLEHQEYPKVLYLWPKDKTLHPTSKTAIANSADEETALKAKGYRNKPHVQEFPDEVPDGFEADLPEASALPAGEASPDLSDAPPDDARKKGKKAN